VKHSDLDGKKGMLDKNKNVTVTYHLINMIFISYMDYEYGLIILYYNIIIIIFLLYLFEHEL